MTVRAVGALVRCGDKRRNQFFVLAPQRTVGKEHRLRKTYHVFQQRQVRGKTLQNARYLLSSEYFAEPLVKALYFLWRAVLINDRKIRSLDRLRIFALCRLFVFECAHCLLELHSHSKLERPWSTGTEEAAGYGVRLVEVRLNRLGCGGADRNAAA